VNRRRDDIELEHMLERYNTIDHYSILFSRTFVSPPSTARRIMEAANLSTGTDVINPIIVLSSVLTAGNTAPGLTM